MKNLIVLAILGMALGGCAGKSAEGPKATGHSTSATQAQSDVTASKVVAFANCESSSLHCTGSGEDQDCTYFETVKTCSDPSCVGGCAASVDGFTCKDTQYLLACYTSVGNGKMCSMSGMNGVWESYDGCF